MRKRDQIRVGVASGAAITALEEGLKIEKVIHGMARSAAERKWVEVG